MTNNNVIRSIMQILEINESTLAYIFKLSGLQVDQATVTGFLKEAGESGHIECNNSQMTQFLDGLITYRRGKSAGNTTRLNQTIPLLNNNSILKKLRIAFDLREDDLIELLSLADFEAAKNEISAVFRKEGHKHFRECNDELLMALLVGLTFRKWNP